MAKLEPTDNIAQKFPDLALREFANGNTDERVSVIVELKIPPQKLALDKRNRSDRTGSDYARMKVLDEPALQQKRNALIIERARETLESVLGTSPHWLSSARAFVISVTPEQLREIARSPLAKTIRPNRRLGRAG